MSQRGDEGGEKPAKARGEQRGQKENGEVEPSSVPKNNSEEPLPPTQPSCLVTSVLESCQLGGVPAQTHGTNTGQGWSCRRMTV